MGSPASKKYYRGRRRMPASTRICVKTFIIALIFLVVAVTGVTVFTGIMSQKALDSKVEALCLQAEKIYSQSGGKLINVSANGITAQWIDKDGRSDGSNKSLAESNYKGLLNSKSKNKTYISSGRLSDGISVITGTKQIYLNNNLIGAVWYAAPSGSAALTTALSCAISFVVCAGLLIVIVLSTRRSIKDITDPIEEINVTANKIALGDFNIRMAKKRDDEIGDLCDSINDMASSLYNNEKMKSEFISSVSHELRTPLTAIKGWAETMQGGDCSQDMINRGMSIISHESERLSGMVEELLDFSRIQNSVMKANLQRMDILDELNESVYLFIDRAKAERKNLVFKPPKSLLPIYGDQNRLRQVFVNLLDNALKYTDMGGTVSVNAKNEDGYVIISIKDNGCGIPAKHLPNVRKKFYKANNIVGGSGIGLAVADEIIALHNGNMDIQSQEYFGTTITIKIPSCRVVDLS